MDEEERKEIEEEEERRTRDDMKRRCGGAGKMFAHSFPATFIKYPQGVSSFKHEPPMTISKYR